MSVAGEAVEHVNFPAMATKDRSGCCNPVKKAGPVSLDHVLSALGETKEERESRIRSLFSFFDSDNAGYLDYAKIEKGLSAMQIPAEYKFAKELLNGCDANKDGRVDYQEFRKYMDDKEMELYRIFQDIDVEHSGCILPEELWDALVNAGTLLLFILLKCFTFLVPRLMVKYEYDIGFLITGGVSGLDVQHNCLLWFIKRTYLIENLHR